MNAVIAWLADPAHWSGSDGILARTGEHLWYSAIALALAMLIGIPLGLFVGHTGRGRIVVVNSVGAVRAIPTLGLLFLCVLFFAPRLGGDAAYLLPSLIVLVVLAVPPILAGTYSGVDEVDSGARDAARGMGMTGGEVLRLVEIPCALPLMLSGVRSALLQIIATATVAATVSLGGLGRFLIDGLALRDYAQMGAGAVLVAALALMVEGLAALLTRLVVSPGLSGRHRTRHKSPQTAR